jgi:hypothetical protein
MICIKFEGEFTIIKELASDLKKKGLLETCLRATHRQAKSCLSCLPAWRVNPVKK